MSISRVEASTLTTGGGGGSGSSDSEKPNPFKTLFPMEMSYLEQFLPPEDIRAIAATDRKNRAFFGLFANPHGAHLAVLEGSPKRLKIFIRRHLALLFEQLDVVDRAGQCFYKISPYQLMIFLADDRMLKDIMSMECLRDLPEALEATRQSQVRELDAGGGADIVKLDFDPTSRPFEAVLSMRQRFCPWGERTRRPLITFPLLENDDGILCYHNVSTDEVTWYYANKKTKEIIELVQSDAPSPDLDKFTVSCKVMEAESARRSSIEEHEIINAQLLKDFHFKLREQQGVEYTDVSGVRYRDTGFSFHGYFNKARECFRHYQAENYDEGDRAWLELGGKQKEVIWLLQLPYQPDLTLGRFSRDLPAYDNYRCPRDNNDRLVFSSQGGFIAGLGSQFTISYPFPGSQEIFAGIGAICNLLPLFLLIEDAKSKVKRLLQKPEVSHVKATSCNIQ